MKQATQVPCVPFILINGTLMCVPVNNRFPTALDDDGGDDDDDDDADDAEKPLQKKTFVTGSSACTTY